MYCEQRGAAPDVWNVMYCEQRGQPLMYVCCRVCLQDLLLGRCLGGEGDDRTQQPLGMDQLHHLSKTRHAPSHQETVRQGRADQRGEAKHVGRKAARGQRSCIVYWLDPGEGSSQCILGGPSYCFGHLPEVTVNTTCTNYSAKSLLYKITLGGAEASHEMYLYRSFICYKHRLPDPLQRITLPSMTSLGKPRGVARNIWEEGGGSETCTRSESNSELPVFGNLVHESSALDHAATEAGLKSLRSRMTRLHKNLFSAMLAQVMLRLLIYADRDLNVGDMDQNPSPLRLKNTAAGNILEISINSFRANFANNVAKYGLGTPKRYVT
ncbi:unnamed protein product [Timema podura]|uniref:Uncharacterized protein n=1 Tax=Timema podura TaxID=61482 RepID=A0ABN7NM07_TIMPD|nr:unnamed protein product [Timema podura]